jgi:hypothetical protein
MKKSIDDAFDDHPPDADRPRVSWAVAIRDDCDDCEDLRVEVTVEEDGRRGAGTVLHLSPQSARRLRGALRSALREVGEPPD